MICSIAKKKNVKCFVIFFSFFYKFVFNFEKCQNKRTDRGVIQLLMFLSIVIVYCKFCTCNFFCFLKKFIYRKKNECVLLIFFSCLHLSSVSILHTHTKKGSYCPISLIFQWIVYKIVSNLPQKIH